MQRTEKPTFLMLTIFRISDYVLFTIKSKITIFKQKKKLLDNKSNIITSQ